MQPRKLFKLANPIYLIERAAMEIAKRRLLCRFMGTPASSLSWDLLGTAPLLFALESKRIKTIYDVGANIGYWTIMAKSIFPDARIDCFEPIPESLEILRDRISHLSQVHIHDCALGSEKGYKSIFVLGKDSDCSSFLSPVAHKPTMIGQKDGRRVNIRLERMDDVAMRSGVYPDLIKLDVQGYELEVLKGAEKCLERAVAVQAEVSFEEFYEGQTFFRDIVDFLDDRGFKLHMFANYDSTKPFVQLDALFLKR